MTWPAFLTAAAVLTLMAVTHLFLHHANNRLDRTDLNHTQIRDFYKAAYSAITTPGVTTASIDQLQAAARDINTQLPHHLDQAAHIARTNMPPARPDWSRT